MAYITKELYDQAIKVIKKHQLIFIDDIVSYLPCTRPTFYEHFPVDSNNLNNLKELLYDNRVVIKTGLRKKWNESDNATLQMGLYKLTGTDEERKRLSQTHHDLTSAGEKIDNTVTVDVISPKEE